jgi:hypothetical protein
MSRIIINIDDNIPVRNAVHYVDDVISMGRMNEGSYFYATMFKDGTIVLADVTKAGTDVFNVRKGVLE